MNTKQEIASPRVMNGVDELEVAVGTELGTSDWILVDQELIDRFADVTGDNYLGARRPGALP